MKLVRFDDWKTGLLVQLPIGLRVIDVVESLGALSFAAPFPACSTASSRTEAAGAR